MVAVLKQIWNYDFATDSKGLLKWLFIPLVVFICIFGVYDLFVDTGSGLYNLLTNLVSKGENPLSNLIPADKFKWMVYLMLGFFVVYVSAFAAISFFASIKKYGRERFIKIFTAHILSNVVAMLTTFLLFACFGFVAYLLGFTFKDGEQFVSMLYAKTSEFLKNQIPTITILPYPLALLAGVVFGALPGYFSHWLGHHSRVVWYASHRCHHTAEIMHPAGVGPFMFLPEFFSNLPTMFITAACTKLFYYEPLVFETIFLAFIGILTEKFNHTSVFYNFAYHNPVVRWVSAYFGNGVYHYMHHTSKPGDEIINVGGSPFLIWDRVFGTYRTPTAEKPKVGLTKNPIIKLNPFAIVLSGWAQIWYELRMNKDWKTRFMILFGSVYYTPPITKDFLILGYPDSNENKRGG